MINILIDIDHIFIVFDGENAEQYILKFSIIFPSFYCTALKGNFVSFPGNLKICDYHEEYSYYTVCAKNNTPAMIAVMELLN